jgi:hypothetical protein|tara:strand:- start:23 stop:316 length:294 start_codon:yes stop_codon:yes gene_type:complete
VCIAPLGGVGKSTKLLDDFMQWHLPWLKLVAVVQARRPEKYIAFFWPSAFVTRKMTPQSRKSGYGLLLGCRSPLDARHEKQLFLAMFEKIIGQKLEK